MNDFSHVIDDVAVATATTTQIAVIKANASHRCTIRVVEITQAAATTSESSAWIARSTGGTAGAAITSNPLATSNTESAAFTVNKISAPATLGAVMAKQIFPSNYGVAVLKCDGGLQYPGITLEAGEQASIVYRQTTGGSITPNLQITVSNY
jgi:hypothetical protein